MLNEDILRKVIPNINEVSYGIVKNVRTLTEKEIGDIAQSLAESEDKKLVLNYEDALNLLATCLNKKIDIHGKVSSNNGSVRVPNFSK